MTDATVPQTRWRKLRYLATCLLLTAIVSVAVVGYQHFYLRYQFTDSMLVEIDEVSTSEYPEDPAGRSIHYGQYNDRKLRLVQRDDKHFDFVLEPTNDHTAKIVVRNVDVSLMTPSVPEWCHGDEGLVRIALTDREWNRQQVWFDRDGGHVEVVGGDGFEEERLYKVALAKNCLNAGLWEVILAVEEDGKKGMYYQGWFTFPMGHYRRLVEANTGLDYSKYWRRLEHWVDPAGTVMNLAGLREVLTTRDLKARFCKDEPLLARGEQIRKKRTLNGPNLVTWGDMLGSESVHFASFVPPGRYSVSHPWENEYWRLASFKGAVLREITTPANEGMLHELELVFRSTDGDTQRFLVGGVNLSELPQLDVADYPQGLYMPMGIGVPPFYQSYKDLESMPPDESGYYSLLLDEENRWIDHHKAAIDGPVMHRDPHDPDLVHLYLLSYERHSLVAHFEIRLQEAPVIARQLESVETR